jgi:hypothetical protein
MRRVRVGDASRVVMCCASAESWSLKRSNTFARSTNCLARNRADAYAVVTVTNRSHVGGAPPVSPKPGIARPLRCDPKRFAMSHPAIVGKCWGVGSSAVFKTTSVAPLPAAAVTPRPPEPGLAPGGPAGPRIAAMGAVRRCERPATRRPRMPRHHIRSRSTTFPVCAYPRI